MAVRIESMAEPLPGYRLIERLGGGGFGEVWKAEAPGGLFKAIKFVYGDLESSDENGARAGQEFKALQRVITVRHPFILSLERFDVIDGQLMIVTELADRTLWDRFRECRAQGLVGVPRDELLRYLTDTAEALDLMNSQYQLQHLDIKPQNLFLVHNHVKVADFGLVKDLEGMLASVTGGVTPVYAAPETFEGKVSRYSDQYSLAIVYQELLTGQRPYSGTTLRQLVMQHCQGTPDLKPLPIDDRSIVLRALAKSHDDRYPSCQDFIAALRTAGQPTTQTSNTTAPRESHSKSGQMLRPDDGEKTETRQAISAAPQAPQATPGPTQAVPGRKQKTPATPQPPSNRVASETPSRSGERGLSTPDSGIRDPGLSGTAGGVLAPAVIVGLGALGLATLRQLRGEIMDNFGSAEALPSLRLLFVDTDPQTIKFAIGGRDHGALRSEEVLLTRLHRPSHYARPREGGSGMEAWLPTRILYRMPRQQTAGGIRALGRLAFIDNYKTISRRLEMELQACCSRQALEKAMRETGLGLRTPIPRVFVISSLAGGTGSGMFLDMAYLARQKLHQLGYPSGDVVGLCFLPPVKSELRSVPELANTFAALTELNHFNTKHGVFTARYELGEARAKDPVFSWKGTALRRCQFFSLNGSQEAALKDGSNGGGGLAAGNDEVLATAAHIVFAELTTSLGSAVDEQRDPAKAALEVNLPQHQTPGVTELRGPVYQTAGMFRLVWPRRQLLEQAGALVCTRLVQRWMSKNAKPLQQSIQQWVQQQWEDNGFTAEQVIGRYQQGCDEGVGKSLEATFQSIHATLAKEMGTSTSKSGEKTISIAGVLEAMQQMEQLVGVPEECRPVCPRGEISGYQRGSVELALEEIADKVTERFAQKLAELAVCLIEDPNFRLAGAEEALRQLHGQVEQSLQAHEQLTKELHERAVIVYQRIQTLVEKPIQNVQSPTWKPAFVRRGNSAGPMIAELLDLVKSYPKCRYQSLILQRITALYVSLRGLLSDQLREVDYCRARLGELVVSLGEAAGSKPRHQGVPAAGRYLAANGCKSIEEAVKKLDNSIGNAELMELDIRIQSLIRGQFKALVHVCMTSANVLKSLVPKMLKEARAYLRARLGENHVAEIYLRPFKDGDKIASARVETDLAAAFEMAGPEVVASPPLAELNVLAVTPGGAEPQLRVAAAAAIDGKHLVAASSGDEITMYREHTLGCLADLAQMGPVAQEAYERALDQDNFTPHSRCDITDWGTGCNESA